MMNHGSLARWWGAAGLAAALWSCGQPLVTGDYRGEPLLELQGRIVTEAGASTDASGELRVAIFWLRSVESAQEEGLSGQATEQPVVLQSHFPARYAITLYAPPAGVELQTVPGGSGEIAFALLLLYVDQDGDGAFARGVDRLAGGTERYLVAWTPDGARGELLGGRLDSGYHLMRLSDEGACLEGAALQLMQAASPGAASVDLTLTQEPERVIPDVDCDGLVDLCEALLNAVEAASPDDRPALEEAWRACVSDLWVQPSCEELLAAQERGVPLPDTYADLLMRCQASPEAPLLHEACVLMLELEIRGLLCDEIGQCFPDPPRVFEACLDPMVQAACVEPLAHLLDEPASDALLEDAARCVVAQVPPLLAEGCERQAYEACVGLVPEADPGDEAAWARYELCLRDERQRCGDLVEDPCGPLLDRAATCPEIACFEEALGEVERCRGGAFSPRDAWLCDWWVAGPGGSEEEARRCLERVLEPPAPDQVRCDAACEQAQQLSEEDPELSREIQTCFDALQGAWTCCAEVICCAAGEDACRAAAP